MQELDIAVSIVCLTFNHEKYVRQALDSFISQKTDFRFEVIVHDDASSDGTATIIREYAERYPDVIKTVLQTENQYSKGVPIHAAFTANHVQGKYVALCEGDDFWTDPYKLQKQYDILQAHSECSMCTHIVQEVYEDGSAAPKRHPADELPEGKIDIPGFLKIQTRYPFQTSSYFMRKELWVDLALNPPMFRQVTTIGDEPMLLYMVAHGDIYYLPCSMSCYRIFSSSSWSKRTKNDRRRMVDQTRRAYEMMAHYDEYTDHQYDCNLGMFRGRMLLYSGEYKKLLEKENAPYLKHLSLPRRLYIYACAVFPPFGKLVDLKGKLKSLLMR